MKKFAAPSLIGFALIALSLRWAARLNRRRLHRNRRNGEVHKLSEYQGKFVVLEWTNRSCPYTQKL